MKILLILSALCLLNGAAAASEQPPQTLAVVTAPSAISATMVGGSEMISSPLPEHRRTFVLLVGIAGVAVAFQRGLMGARGKSASH